MFPFIMNTKKYFIAIVLPEPLFTEIEAVKQMLFEKHGLKGALRSPAHITLHRPFDWKEEKENILVEKLQDFKFETPFQIELKNYGAFEPRVIYADVLPNETLFELHKNLTSYAKRELKLFNESDDLRGFHPHVTVAFRDLKKPKFYELEAEFKTKNIAGSFEFVEFCLLKLEKRWEVLKTFVVLNTKD
jgi:2'-5' RNA ligase